MRVVGQDGQVFTLYCDPDRLEQHMKELSPADAHLWVEPGGIVPIVAMSGRNVIQMVCATDRKRFVTSLPGEAGPVNRSTSEN